MPAHYAQFLFHAPSNIALPAYRMCKKGSDYPVAIVIGAKRSLYLAHRLHMLERLPCRSISHRPPVCFNLGGYVVKWSCSGNGHGESL
jgi:hypothetical protein